MAVSELPCHRCARPASWHVEIAEDGPTIFTCDEHQRIAREDDHPIVEGCTDPAATWLNEGCFVVTPEEADLAAALEATADDDEVKGIGWLDPENEYYGINGLWVDDGMTLARLLTRLGWHKTPTA